MALRKVIEIDEEKCDGCGNCIPSCHEGALAIIDGKARLVRDSLCDGIGNCLGECPQGAIRIVEREAEPFVDPHAVEAAHHDPVPAMAPAFAVPVSACPSSAPIADGMAYAPLARAAAPARDISESGGSALRQWPVELSLVSPMAPWLRDADLLVTADCVPFAYANYHRDFLAGRAVVVGCPKLDDLQAHAVKLKAIFETAQPRSVTVLQMEVPCCGGIVRATEFAMQAAGSHAPMEVVTITTDGNIRQGRTGPSPCGSGPFTV
jgi:NAD-dependent dihydropyrimidine dehydrogenase PreA subunit